MHVRLLAFTFALAAACNELGLVLSPTKLLSQLRQTAGNPAAKLGLLLALDLAAVTVAVAVVSGSLSATPGILRDLNSVLTHILTAPKQIVEMPLAEGLRHLTPVDAFQAIFGLLIYSALLRVIGSNGFTGLKRTDKDRHALAMALAERGKGSKALVMLQGVEEPTYDIIQARCLALLQEGRIGSAKIAASEMLRRNPNVRVDPTLDDIYFELFDLWDVLSPEIRKTLQEDAEGVGLSNSVRFAIRVRLQGAASEDVDYEPELFFREVYFDAVQMHRRGERERALQLLNDLKPANHADEFLKLLYSYFLASPSADVAAKRNAYIRSWVRENRRQISKICSSMLHEQMWSNWIVQHMILEMCGAIHALDADTGRWLSQILSQQMEAMRSKRRGAVTADDNARAIETPFTHDEFEDQAYFLDAS